MAGVLLLALALVGAPGGEPALCPRLYCSHRAACSGLPARSPRCARLADEFLMITGATILCTAVVVPLESALRSVGNAAAPTRIGIIAIIANVILQLCPHLRPFRRRGHGCSRFRLGLTLRACRPRCCLPMWRAEPRLIPRKQDWLAAFRRKEVVRFTLIALPLLLHDGLWAFGMLLYGFLYAHLGTDAPAIATTSARWRASLSPLFFQAGGGLLHPARSPARGRGYDEAWQHSQLFLLAPVGALLVGTAVWLMQGSLLQWVGNLPGELMTEAGQVLAIMCVWGMLPKVFNMVGIVGVLRSGGDVNFASSSTSSGMWCIGLPLAWWRSACWAGPSPGWWRWSCWRSSPKCCWCSAAFSSTAGCAIWCWDKGRAQSGKCGSYRDRKSRFAVCPLFNQRQVRHANADPFPCPVVV